MKQTVSLSVYVLSEAVSEVVKYKKGGYIVKKITKDPTYGNNSY